MKALLACAAYATFINSYFLCQNGAIRTNLALAFLAVVFHCHLMLFTGVSSLKCL